MQSTRQRVQERISRNISAMQETGARLADRQTGQFDDELIAWYGETTYNPDPPRNPDIELPDDLGNENPDRLDASAYCERIGAPTEPFVGRVTDSRIENRVNLNNWIQPSGTVNSYNLYFNQPYEWSTSIPVQTGQYAAIPFNWPSTRLTFVGIWANPTQPQHLNSSYEWTVHRCPGYFGEEVLPGCRGNKTAGSPSGTGGANGWTFRYMFETNCGIPAGGEFYLNVRFNAFGNCAAAGNCSSLNVRTFAVP
jgi:hypothetical protein